jgi:phage shock protein A
MGLFKRLQDIITANLGDVVEGCDDPEPVLKQAIREMEEAIGEAKRETARAMAAERLAAKDLADSERQADDWRRQAAQAVGAGDDDKARKALARKQEHDKVSAALRDQTAATGEASRILRHQLEAMQAKLAEAKRRLGTLAARQKAAAVRLRSADAHFETEAFAKFDRISGKIARVEAEAEALRELEAGGRPAPEADPAAEGPNPDVEAELAELKKKAGK